MPGSGQFSVERPTVAAAVVHVNQVHEQINGLLTNLINRLQPVLADSAVFRGDAQVSLVSVHGRFNAAANKINTALADIGNRLQSANTNYASSDAQSTSTVTSAGSGLA